VFLSLGISPILPSVPSMAPRSISVCCCCCGCCCCVILHKQDQTLPPPLSPCFAFRHRLVPSHETPSPDMKCLKKKKVCPLSSNSSGKWPPPVSPPTMSPPHVLCVCLVFRYYSSVCPHAEAPPSPASMVTVVRLFHRLHLPLPLSSVGTRGAGQERCHCLTPTTFIRPRRVLRF